MPLFGCPKKLPSLVFLTLLVLVLVATTTRLYGANLLVLGVPQLLVEAVRPNWN